jgi:hypothetical protein
MFQGGGSWIDDGKGKKKIEKGKRAANRKKSDKKENMGYWDLAIEF